MSGPWVTTGTWVCHSAAGGGLLLLLAWLLMQRTRQPARQQRLGEYGLVAALLLAVLGLGPAWLTVSVPVAETPAVPLTSPEVAGPAPVVPARSSPLPQRPDPGPVVGVAPAWVFEDPAGAAEEPEAAPAPASSPTVELPGTPEGGASPAPAPAVAGAAVPAGVPLRVWLDRLLAGLGVAYVGAASVLAGRCLLGHLVLWRLLGGAGPAPAPAARLFAALAPGRRPPRLLVSRRLSVPVSCGIWRPTVVLPASLCDDPVALRWVFAHELTHLERHDPWTCLLFGLGQVVYFYLPWFWWVRRRVGLCQEFIADAAVAGAEEAPEEYAQFLLGLTRAPAVPAGAASLAGRPSDLCRRITMLLQAPLVLERRCPRGWCLTAAGGLAALAVLAAGLRLQATPAVPPPAEPAPPAQGATEAKTNIQRPTSNVQRPTPDSQHPTRNVQPPAVSQDEKPRPATPRPAPAPQPLTLDVGRSMTNAPAPVVPRPRYPGEGRLGVRTVPPDPVVIHQLDLPRGQGLVLEDVLPDSPAAAAGLRAHDILLALDDRPVPSDSWQLPRLLNDVPGGKAVSARIVRHGRRETVQGLVLPEAWPGAENPRPQGVGVVRTGWVGTAVRLTARHEEGALVIEVTIVAAGGGPRVEEIAVRVAGRASRYARVDQVPAAYRDRVVHLLALAPAGGGHPAVFGL
jgi:hypothetical protein